jgi:2''-5'' RNA ligase
MRLFITILLTDEVKDQICHTIESLKKAADGSFTLRENLHLTLNFIGETDCLKEVEEAMERAMVKAKAEPFHLYYNNIGKFKRHEGDIYWIGVEKENTLWLLQRYLVEELKAAGFPNIEDKEYKPHLTIARKVRIKDASAIKTIEESMNPMHMEAPKISLMKSEHIKGKLVYTEIYQVKFGRSV